MRHTPFRPEPEQTNTRPLARLLWVGLLLICLTCWNAGAQETRRALLIGVNQYEHGNLPAPGG